MAIKNKENLPELVAKVTRVIEANKRRATARTKKRGEVSGGGRKPHRQKGTGRARAGSTRSPLWRGGGVTFGPTGEQNPSLNLNKKEREAVKQAALESKKSNTVELSIGKISKTKEAADLLKKNNISGRTLVLVDEKSEKSQKESESLRNLRRVFGNIKNVLLAKNGDVSGVDVLRADNIVILKMETTKANKIEPKTASKAKVGEKK